jgi:hypothetical protein
MVMMTRSKRPTDDTMPAGRYWVGDLCYVLHDAWSEAWQYGDGVHTLPDGRRIAKFSTLHGDGIYDDDQGNEYGVDSGSLGCILAADIRDSSAHTELGVFVTAADAFTPRRTYPAGASPSFDAGVLHMAGVRIHLDSEANDE